jgi:hypothetical protein
MESHRASEEASPSFLPQKPAFFAPLPKRNDGIGDRLWTLAKPILAVIGRVYGPLAGAALGTVEKQRIVS